ncbi:MAG: sigma 54-interacting transcriptional regulator [candidate division KSB1 bacterium]|nr:sigma 54-interacting transcriptional regulator [candidate division KSB1 bacterium]
MCAMEASTFHILESIGEGLFTVDKDFRINYFNRAAEKITGLNRDEVIGQFCKHVFKSSRCFQECPIARVLESGENIYDLESKIRHKGDSFVPIKLNAAVLKNGENDAVGGVISFRDISDLESIRSRFRKEHIFLDVVGHSKVMQEMFQLIREISDSDATVFIKGESGTGKEMIANAIQATSQRKDMPFVKVNCSVFSPQLLASELFGHVKGAFTGAFKNRPGRFEIADKGTIFLDEVAEMPLKMQLQLLRVLQEGTFERVGESVTRKVDVRVIAATNKKLESALKSGSFREDLFYRLNVIPIEIPPLRERSDDIAYLIRHFINKYSLIYKKDIKEVDDAAMDMLISYAWPGNVRELENAIEYAFARTPDKSIVELSKLPPAIRNFNPCADNVQGTTPEQSESDEILELLEKHHWNKTKVAREMGVGRSTLWRKLKKMGLEN